MSDDAQLTVAELLSRAQRENPGADKPRARRRRSLDEGGVSVAELTGSLKKVEARPIESKHSSVPIDAEPAPEPAPKPAPEPEPEPKPEPDATTVLRKVDAPERPEPKPAPAPATTWSKFEHPEPAAEPSPALAPLDATGEIPAVEDSGYERQVERVTPAAAPAPEAHEDAAPTGGEINPILLVVLVFVGLLVGVAGFLAFQWVWANLPTAGAVAAAAVVTVLVVLGVRALRTGRDGLTMTLAGLAALVMTFGPAAINAL